jgi:DNA (cytosine-5)-methyltransferase 1
LSKDAKLLAASSRTGCVWKSSSRPNATSSESPELKPASSIIDFAAGSWSTINRPGRALATLERIAAGRTQHGERFVTAYYGNEKGGRSLSRPLGTITTRDRWAVIDGERMRMVNVNECRKAMGFPDGYQLPERQKDAMHMLGNAVVPAVARDVIQAIQRAA